MSETVYRSAPHIRWVQDADQLILVNDRTQHSYVLRGADATIWNYLTLNYPFRRLLTAAAELWASPESAADRQLRALLGRWQTAGLIIADAKVT